MIPKLIELPTKWVIEINTDLRPIHTEQKKKGIIWQWGQDWNGKYKLIAAFYPKTFSKMDMNRIIIKYYTCPNCIIGKKNLKFKYGENNNKIMALKGFSIVGLLEKIPKLGELIAKSPQSQAVTERWLMSIMSTLARSPVNFGFNQLFSRLLHVLIGGGGAAVTELIPALRNNERFQNELRTFFANWASSSFDLSPEEFSLGVSDDLMKLKAAIKGRNFYGISNAILRDPEELRRIGQKAKAAITMAFGKIGRKGRMWRQPLTHSPEGEKYGKLSTLGADYKYVDTTKRFRDVSDFSPSFKEKRRLRTSGS